VAGGREKPREQDRDDGGGESDERGDHAASFRRRKRAWQLRAAARPP
jgi:hypothetical protein